MNLESHDSQASKTSGCDVNQSLFISLWVLGNGHSLDVEMMFFRQRSPIAGNAQEGLSGRARPDLDKVDVPCRPRKSPQNAQHESTEAVDLDCLLQGLLNVPQKAEPWLRDSVRHREDAPPSGPTTCSSVLPPAAWSLATMRAFVRCSLFFRRYPHVPAATAPAAAPNAAVHPAG